MVALLQTALGAPLPMDGNSSGTEASPESSGIGQHACTDEYLELYPNSPEYNLSAIECVAVAFAECTPGTTHLHKNWLYFFVVNIHEEISETCHFNVSSYVDAQFEYTYNCAVPSSVMPHWASWKIFPQTWVNETLKEIAEYCGENPGDPAPQNARLQPAGLVVLFLFSVFSVLGVIVLVKILRRKRHRAFRQIPE